MRALILEKLTKEQMFVHRLLKGLGNTILNVDAYNRFEIYNATNPNYGDYFFVLPFKAKERNVILESKIIKKIKGKHPINTFWIVKIKDDELSWERI